MFTRRVSEVSESGRKCPLFVRSCPHRGVFWHHADRVWRAQKRGSQAQGGHISCWIRAGCPTLKPSCLSKVASSFAWNFFANSRLQARTLSCGGQSTVLYTERNASASVHCQRKKHGKSNRPYQEQGSDEGSKKRTHENYTRSKISESIRQIGIPSSSSASRTASVIGGGPQSMKDQRRASSWT